MSTNWPLVDSLELYMDEQHDSFQDYVKKILILLSMGVGTVLLMLGYLVKMLNRPEDVQAARRSRSYRRRSGTSSDRSHSSEHTNYSSNSKDRHSSYNKRLRQSHSHTSVQSCPICCHININSRKTISSPMSASSSFYQNKFDVERHFGSNIVIASSKSVCAAILSCSSCCSDCIHCLPQIHVCPSSKSRPRKSSSGPKKKMDRFSSTLTCTYIGMYRHNSRDSLRAPPSGLNHTSSRGASVHTMHTLQTDLARYSAMAANYFWTMYSTLNGSYVAIFTVVLIVMLSFVVPDLSQKLHRTQELKAMKKVLMKMSGEVSRAEVACLAVADEIRCLHCSMQDGGTETLKNQKSICQSGEMQVTQSEPVHLQKKLSLFRRFFYPRKNVSHKEVTIMSYLYTDSFDGGAEQIQNKNSNSLSEKIPAKDLNQ